MRPPFAVNPSWPHFLGIAAVALGIVAGLVRHVLSDFSDPMHCRALLTRGRWLDSNRRNWQPDGCMLHSYNKDQASACFNSKQVIFVGDSIVRSLYFQLVHILDPTFPTPLNDTPKHSNHILHTNTGSDVSFIWDPYLNSSRTLEILTRTNSTSKDERPSLLVLGSGLWYLRYANTSGGLPSWEANMEYIFDILAHDRDKPADEVVLLPVEQVITPKLSYERSHSMISSDIDAMNSDLLHRIYRPSYDVFSVSSNKAPSLPVALPLVFNQMLDSSQTEDGLHFSNSLVALQANIILNLRCNNLLPKKFPFDKTCCNAYPWPSTLQFVILGLAMAWGPVIYLLSRSGRPQNFPWSRDLQRPALIFSATFSLVFVADRTGFWLKEQKQFNPWIFGSLCLVSLAIGLATTEQGDKDLGFLNRDQTDEWKGWMQIVILIYHYCGASKVSGIYNPIRVLVASYLFMTGYGHTIFYLKKKDFGFLRLAQVLVRLNLLTVLLAYTMNTDYISYYFSPLVSMWFLIIYATMAVASWLNDRTPFLVGKILVSASLVTWFMEQEWIMHSLFDILRRVFRINWSAYEWAFRVNLDLWIVYTGMFTAIAATKFREHRLTEYFHWPLVAKLAMCASGVCLMWFFAFELYQESKFTYNLWHPYISFLPILAFVILRNASVILRSASSSAFAFIGRCSLETFIIQYHLWLAGDTKGILVVLPGVRWRPVNFVITTIIFIFISDQTARSTTQITNWICGETSKSLLLPTTTASNNHSMQLTQQNTISLIEANNGHNTTVSIPLITGSNDIAHKDIESSLSREPDTPNQSHVDHLAEGSVWPARAPGFRIWYDGSQGYGVKTRLMIGIGVMWIVNVLWPSSTS